jgi:hypothetical protein
VNKFGVECNGIGGQPPVTLAEFTLSGSGGSDFYDLSNVDGYSIGMEIRPIPGQFKKVNNPKLGKFNCGTVCLLKMNVYLKISILVFQASCTFNTKKCPPELQMDDGAGHKVCASICAAINNAQQRAKHADLQKIFNNPDTRSLVCCSCDGNHCVRTFFIHMTNLEFVF